MAGPREGEVSVWLTGSAREQKVKVADVAWPEMPVLRRGETLVVIADEIFKLFLEFMSRPMCIGVPFPRDEKAWPLVSRMIGERAMIAGSGSFPSACACISARCGKVELIKSTTPRADDTAIPYELRSIKCMGFALNGSLGCFECGRFGREESELMDEFSPTQRQ